MRSSMADDGPGQVGCGFRRRPAWLAAVVLLAVAQVGLAGRLFDADRPWDAVADDRPVLNGRHPLRLYHAGLGADTFRRSLAVTCFDPNFQAGYPKTPVFDSAARLPELAVFAFGGGGHDPAAYKLGLLVLCGLVPLVFAAAARGFGVPAAGCCWAGIGGCVVWWAPPVRPLLDAAAFDLLGVGLAAVLFLGGLARYASAAGGVSGWALMAAASVLGWYAHPVAWAGVLPAVAIVYLVAAPRRGLAWHLGSAAVLLLGVAANLWWMTDWSRFLWMRRECDDPSPPDWVAFANLDVMHDNGLSGPTGWAVVAVAAVGLMLMIRKERCGAAGGLIASAALALLAARLGAVWPAARAEGAAHAAALVPALAVLPAAFALSAVLRPMRLGGPLTLAAIGLFTLVGWHQPTADALSAVIPPVYPLRLGLADDQQHLVAALRERTTRDARILVEDADPARDGWNWTALLPHLTDRFYLGGLDADAHVEHGFCSLRHGRLADRPFADWTAADRADLCRRYNVGWVLCRTTEAANWWATDPAARLVGRYTDAGVEVVLFELIRPRSFVLSGSATVERMDPGRIVLTDVVPDANHQVRLSLHFQKQVRAGPSPLVWAVAEKDPHDPVPFLTLTAAGPVSRVTLTWEHP